MNILDLKRSLLPMRGYRGYGSDSEGGASEGVGGEGTSAGSASAAGGSDMGGSYGGGGGGDSYSDALAAQANALADALSVDPLDALMANTGAFGTAPDYGSGSISPDGYTYGQLGMLNDLGYGSLMGVNPNNLTQSIAEAMNAQAAHGWLNQNIPTLFSLASPAAGALVSALQKGLGVVSGKTSIGAAATDFAMQQVAQRFGVPVGVVKGVIDGNPGQAISAGTAGAIRGAVSTAIADVTGIPAGIVSAGIGLTNAPGMLSSGITSTVNSALGVSPSGQTNTSSIASAIDSALGSSPGTSSPATGVSSSGGGFSFGNIGGGGGDSSGAFNPFASFTPTPTPTLSTAAPVSMTGTSQTFGSSAVQPDAAAIKSMQNLWGPGVDPNFLTSNANQFSDGGSIDDLLHILRS